MGSAGIQEGSWASLCELKVTVIKERNAGLLDCVWVIHSKLERVGVRNKRMLLLFLSYRILNFNVSFKADK